MQADLKALVAYYLKCLAEERLGQPEARVAEAKGMLFPTPPPLPDSWEALLASEPALCAHRSASRKEGTAVLWAPVQWVKQGRDDLVLEPVCGIFCTVTPQKLIADPADVWVGDVLSSELAGTAGAGRSNPQPAERRGTAGTRNQRRLGATLFTTAEQPLAHPGVLARERGVPLRQGTGGGAREAREL
jgi:hypothetical protein